MKHTTTNDNQSWRKPILQQYLRCLYESWPERVSINVQQITGIEHDLELLFHTPAIPVPAECSVCSE